MIRRYLNDVQFWSNWTTPELERHVVDLRAEIAHARAEIAHTRGDNWVHLANREQSARNEITRRKRAATIAARKTR